MSPILKAALQLANTNSEFRKVLAKEIAQANRFELVYSTGGHGGPYNDLEEAKKHAEIRLRGGRDNWIAVVPATKINNLPNAGVVDILFRNKGWSKTILQVLIGGRKATMKLSMSMGKTIFQNLVDIKKLYATRKVLSQAGDKTTEELLRDVMTKLMEELEPKNPRIEAAVNRLNNAIHGTQDPDNLRNQIFKVANELGIRLPHSIFASTQA